MSTWRTLRFGTKVLASAFVAGLAGVAVYTTTGWWTQARAWAALLEAAEQADRAVNIGTAATQTVVTNWVTTWAADPSGASHRGGAYVAYAGTNALVMTNSTQGYTFSVPITTNAGRWIWSGWSNLTVAGFPTGAGSGEDPDGTYYLAGYRDGIGYWTNSFEGFFDTPFIADHGRAVGWKIQAHDYADINRPIWERTVTQNDFYTLGWPYTVRSNWLRFGGGSSGMGAASVTPSALNTNAIHDAPALVTYTAQVAITRQRPGTNVVNGFDAALKALVPQFVKPSDPVSSNGTANYWSVTGLWAHLEIGDRTNLFTRTPAYTNAATTNAATFGNVPVRMHKVHFDERWAVLNALTVTAYNASQWSNAIGYVASSNAPRQNYEQDVYIETSNAWTGVRTVDLPLSVSDFPYTNFPTWWMYSGESGASAADFSGPFWTSIVNRAYGGNPPLSGADQVGYTNAHGPRWSYDWRFDMRVIQDEDTVQWDGFSLIALDRVQRDWEVNVDTDRYEHAESALLLTDVLRNDVTGATVRVEWWGFLESRTNSLSATYYRTNDAYTLASTGHVYAATNAVIVGPSVSLSAQSIATVSAGTIGNTNSTKHWTANPEPSAQAFYTGTTEDDGDGLTRYYGQRLTNTATLLYWTFNRSTN